ncbi:MAG TPA: hypothetical protein VH020_16535 [Stellaceae bacterium]|jgi:hypothetical protein|nr:hypothetical protein [Stellaceae bacterium]
MIRSLIGGVAAIALLAGVAHAQDSTTYYNRTTTTTTFPFGETYRSTTTTTAPSAPVNEDVEAQPMPPPPPMAEIPPPPDEQSADIGVPPPPPPGSAPGYTRETTTRQVDPYGNETDRTDTVQQNRSYYDESSNANTQTRSTVTNYAPSPPLPLVPGQTTTTTTTTTDDDE